MDYSALQKDIVLAVKRARKGSVERELIFSDPRIAGKHEFLFFIKPEITLESEKIRMEAILDMIMDKIKAFGLSVRNALLLPASYLKQHSIIARHYGVINAIARNARQHLSKQAISRFEEIYSTSFEQAVICGGIEFLQKYPEFNATSLDWLCQNAVTQKLGGGAYCVALQIDGAPVFLANGFHPRQLEHFTLPGRSIVAFTLCGDLDWNAARNAFIGKTNPAEAASGSIRRTLLEEKERFGLDAVSSSWNGVHLSAGPVEGLVELIRYNTDFNTAAPMAYDDFAFGRMLAEYFTADVIQDILNNVNINYKGKTVSIFDLTEERNADEAFRMLRETFSSR